MVSALGSPSIMSWTSLARNGRASAGDDSRWDCALSAVRAGEGWDSLRAPVTKVLCPSGLPVCGGYPPSRRNAMAIKTLPPHMGESVGRPRPHTGCPASAAADSHPPKMRTEVPRAGDAGAWHTFNPRR